MINASLVSRTISKLRRVFPEFDEFQVRLDEYADMDDGAPAWRKYELVVHLSMEACRYVMPLQSPDGWQADVIDILSSAYAEAHQER